MTNTSKRVIVGAIMAAVVAIVACLQYFGLPAVKYTSVIVVLMMIAEYIRAIFGASRKVIFARENVFAFAWLGVWLVLMLCAAWHVGTRPWIMLLMLIIIAGADIGAWFFGRMLGGDKMWARMSENKTWAGQIAGILCGTFMSVMYGLLGADTFMPQLMWIGISVALLSQYGDLTASWIKRKLGLKDFSNILPGHGGILDRFDGWIYVLPIIWLVMM